MTGNLYLIPVTLGEQDPLQVIPAYNIAVINQLTHFVCEEGKSARRFLKSINLVKPLQELFFYELNEHSNPADSADLLKPLFNGKDMGLMSDAGCPGIADPGAELVKLAHKNGIKVIPLVGPSSILLALMASGFNGQNFAFNGYLPKEKSMRTKKLKELEKLAYSNNQTQLFIETPYRNIQLFEELISTLNPSTMLQLACNISLPDEYIKSLPLAQWKRMKPDIHKKPCIFAVYK